ncbi:MAG: monooxygenase family protein [Acidimicrobiales bacterium]
MTRRRDRSLPQSTTLTTNSYHCDPDGSCEAAVRPRSSNTGAALRNAAPTPGTRTSPTPRHGPSSTSRAGAATGDVGIWHETYIEPRERIETLYGNMPPYGLAAAHGWTERAANHTRSPATAHTRRRSTITRPPGRRDVAVVLLRRADPQRTLTPTASRNQSR